jgi:hypothetical protein
VEIIIDTFVPTPKQDARNYDGIDQMDIDEDNTSDGMEYDVDNTVMGF